MLSMVIIYLIFCVGYSGFETLSEQKYEDSMGWDAMPVKYKLKYGDYPKNENEQFVSLGYAREFKWSVGNTYEYFYVVINESDGELIRKSKNITISGIYEDVNYEPDEDVTYPVEIWDSVLYGEMTPEIKENIWIFTDIQGKILCESIGTDCNLFSYFNLLRHGCSDREAVSL